MQWREAPFVPLLVHSVLGICSPEMAMLKDQVAVENTILDFDLPFLIQLLMDHFFASDQIADVAPEIIHPAPHLLENQR